MWCEQCPTGEVGILANSLAIPYFTAPLLETMDLKGCPFCGFWVAHRPLGACNYWVKSFVYTFPLSSLCLDGPEYVDKVVFVLAGWVHS